MNRKKVGAAGRGVKKKSGSQGEEEKCVDEEKPKPLAGKLFYLDICSRTLYENIQKSITELGGTVEGFFSKDIDVLISSKREAKTRMYEMPSSPEPAPEPESNREEDGKAEDSKKKPDVDDASRGKSILRKVLAQKPVFTGTTPKNEMFAKAVTWGVRVLHWEEARFYILKKMQSVNPAAVLNDSFAVPLRRISRSARLQKPYIKVEDVNSTYRPFFMTAQSFQSFQPFFYKRFSHFASIPRELKLTHEACLSVWYGNGKPVPRKPKIPAGLPAQDPGPKNKGYCECCHKHFENLESHLQEECHETFSRGASLYKALDYMISLCKHDFVPLTPHVAKSKSPTPPAPEVPTVQVGGQLAETHKIAPEPLTVKHLPPADIPAPDAPIVGGACATFVPAPCRNPAYEPEPIFLVPNPHVQSPCNLASVTRTPKMNSSQVLTSTYENMALAYWGGSPNLSLSHQEGARSDFQLRTCDSRQLMDESALNIQGSGYGSDNYFGKRPKLNDFGAAAQCGMGPAAPPVWATRPNRDLEQSFPLPPPPPLYTHCQLPHNSANTDLHRNINPLEQEAIPGTSASFKASVPQENAFAVSRARLEYVFQNTDSLTEFCGFSDFAASLSSIEEDEDEDFEEEVEEEEEEAEQHP